MMHLLAMHVHPLATFLNLFSNKVSKKKKNFKLKKNVFFLTMQTKSSESLANPFVSRILYNF